MCVIVAIVPIVAFPPTYSHLLSAPQMSCAIKNADSAAVQPGATSIEVIMSRSHHIKDLVDDASRMLPFNQRKLTQSGKAAEKGNG